MRRLAPTSSTLAHGCPGEVGGVDVSGASSSSSPNSTSSISPCVMPPYAASSSADVFGSPTTRPIFICVGSTTPLSALATSPSVSSSSFGLGGAFGRILPSRPTRITEMMPPCWCSTFSPYVFRKMRRQTFLRRADRTVCAARRAGSESHLDYAHSDPSFRAGPGRRRKVPRASGPPSSKPCPEIPVPRSPVQSVMTRRRLDHQRRHLHRLF